MQEWLKQAHLDDSNSLDVTDSLSSIVGSLVGQIAKLCSQGVQWRSGVDFLLQPVGKSPVSSQRMYHTSGNLL